jgi:hypothetical protein
MWIKLRNWFNIEYLPIDLNDLWLIIIMSVLERKRPNGAWQWSSSSHALLVVIGFCIVMKFWGAALELHQDCCVSSLFI